MSNTKVEFTSPDSPLHFEFSDLAWPIDSQQKKACRLEIFKKLPKGYIPFHAVLLSRDNQTFLVSGPSKSGKSTFSESLVMQGYKILANDMVIVWEKDNQIVAGDINFPESNKGKNAKVINQIIFLKPEDPRDHFGFTKNELVEFYINSLLPLEKTFTKKFTSQSIFKKITKKHIVLGNRSTPERTTASWNYTQVPKSISKIGIIGLGTVGQELVNLLQTSSEYSIHVYSPNQNKLSSVVLDLKSANPNNQINMCSSPLEVFENSDIVVFSFNIKNPSVVLDINNERMLKIFVHAQVIWELSRQVRKSNYQGKILIVSNPVDVLSFLTQHFSNLDDNYKFDGKGVFTSQVYGIGLGLDFARLKTITNSQKFELIGEHGENILLGTRNKALLTHTPQDVLLNYVKSYSAAVREFTDRTKFGPAHEVYRVIKSLRNKSKKVLRISSLNSQNVYLGDIQKIEGSISTPIFDQDQNLKNKLQEVISEHKAMYTLVLDRLATLQDVVGGTKPLHGH